MHVEIVWDENNEPHATERATITEITQAVLDADGYVRSKTHGSNRAALVGTTNGGRRLRVVVEVRDAVTVRPITAWEER